MTHEQFIKLSTAKLTKQAGFNWRTYTHYQDVYKNRLLQIGSSENWNQYKDCCSAPTQAVLQRWLREVKGYSVLVSHDFQLNKHGWWILQGNDMLCHNYKTQFDTYEAALEAGLQKCLNLILGNQ